MYTIEIAPNDFFAWLENTRGHLTYYSKFLDSGGKVAKSGFCVTDATLPPELEEMELGNDWI